MNSCGMFEVGVRAFALFAFAWSLIPNLAAEPVEDRDFAALQVDAGKSFKEVVTPFVNNYCTRCHGQDRQKGGINFGPALKSPGESASSARWKQAIAAVKLHDMPPEDAKKQPTEEEREKFLEGIGNIKFLSSKDPGPFVIRRLTRAEYGNTLRDLFGVDSGVASQLPDEVTGAGYLNTLSPMQSEQYLAIANEVLDRVMTAKMRGPRS